MTQTRLKAISMDHVVINSFAENVEPSLPLLEQGHMQLFLQQSRTEPKKESK